MLGLGCYATMWYASRGAQPTRPTRRNQTRQPLAGTSAPDFGPVMVGVLGASLLMAMMSIWSSPCKAPRLATAATVGRAGGSSIPTVARRLYPLPSQLARRN